MATKIDSSLRDSSTASRVPLERISIQVSPSEKEQLQKLAIERDRSLSSMGRLAIQAYLYAIRHQKKKKALIKKNGPKSV